MRALLIIALTAVAVQASRAQEWWIVTTSRVDYAERTIVAPGYRGHVREDWRDFAALYGEPQAALPALYWVKGDVWATVTGKVAQAKSDCRSQYRAAKGSWWTRAERQYTNSVVSIAVYAGTNVATPAACSPWDVYRLLQDVPASNRVAAYREGTECALIGLEMILRWQDAQQDGRRRRLNWIEAMQ